MKLVLKMKKNESNFQIPKQDMKHNYQIKDMDRFMTGLLYEF